MDSEALTKRQSHPRVGPFLRPLYKLLWPLNSKPIPQQGLALLLQHSDLGSYRASDLLSHRPAEILKTQYALVLSVRSDLLWTGQSCVPGSIPVSWSPAGQPLV